MLYVDFTAGNKDYKLRLNTRNIVSLEKALGCNPLMIFGLDGERFPAITEMLEILHNSLQSYHHSISKEDTYKIFDEYLADGNTASDFIKVIFDVYKASGIIREDAKIDGESEKN